jgi:hypothetical protein
MRAVSNHCVDGLSDSRVGRALLLMLVTSAAISCGGSTITPTPAPQVQLPDGNYSLTINSTGSCFQNSSGGAPAVSSTITTAVTLQRSATSWAVRLNDANAGNLTVTLNPSQSGSTVAGSATGSLTVDPVRVTFNHTFSGAAQASGGATGLVQPHVTYEAVAGNASTNCVNNVWTLTPR